jgi:hypothetical protein
MPARGVRYRGCGLGRGAGYSYPFVAGYLLALGAAARRVGDDLKKFDLWRPRYCCRPDAARSL